MTALTSQNKYQHYGQMAFDGVSNIDMLCYQYVYEHSESAKTAIRDYFLTDKDENFFGDYELKPKYQQVVVDTALSEIRYPQPLSDRARAQLIGMNRKTYTNNNLGFFINFLLDKIEAMASTASDSQYRMHQVQRNQLA